MGDLILFLPCLDALKRKFPQAEITLAADRRWKDLLLALEPARIHSFEDAGSLRWARVLHDPNPEDRAWLLGFDLFYGVVADGDSHIASLLNGLGFTVVTAETRELHPGRGRVAFLTAPRPVEAPAALHYGRLLAKFGYGTVEPLARLHSLEAEPPDPPRLTLHPGSSAPARRMPFDWFVALAREARERGLSVVWFAGVAEEGILELVQREAECRGDRLLVDQPLRRVAAVLQKARLHVGHDTGVTHLAAALGTRVEALFGPSDPAVWAPPAAWVQVRDFAAVSGSPGRQAALQRMVDRALLTHDEP